ncbi:MAG: DNA polymerase IV [Desulfobacterales bacterium]
MILHVDMDAFYAAVEQRDRPELRGLPVVVGGTGGRGVVAAASYEARAFGVRSAMPMAEARRLCPQAVFLPPRGERYREVARRIREVLASFSPVVEPVSIDEAFLDLAGTERLHGPPEAAGRRLKERILAAVGLTCSVGIAPNRFLAKAASDFRKPDGLTVVAPGEVESFLAALPLEKAPGVGPRTRERLSRFGVRFMGEIARIPGVELVALLGRAGERLSALARGIDATPVTPVSPARSFGSECTLARDTRDRDLLRRLLLEHAQAVAGDLRAAGMRARTVVLKIRQADFSLNTRRRTWGEPAASSHEIYRRALALLEGFRIGKPVRLIGIAATGLVPAGLPCQRALFDEQGRGSAEWERIDRAVAAIEGRFGEGAVRRASLRGETKPSPGPPGRGRRPGRG